MLHICSWWVMAWIAIGHGGTGAGPCPGAESYEGEIVLRGDRWPVRLHVARPSGGPRADGSDGANRTRGADGSDAREGLRVTLDLPELLMAGEEIEAGCEDGGLALDLPFGLGAVHLATAGDGALAGRRAVGAADTLVLRLSPGGERPYRTRELRFGADPSLAGTLYLPTAPGRHPGVVLVHGSGAQGRDEWAYRSWADFYARRGIAALAYDKRGVGASEGDFRTDSAFVGLTDDVLAAVRALRATPGVDPARVGLAGHSQAGWIALRAAARDPHLSFLVLIAAPAVSVAEQEVQRVEAGMRAGGFDEGAVEAAVAHTRLLFRHLETGEGREELAASSRRARTMEWAARVHTPDSAADLGWWRTHREVDPAAWIRALRVPVLALYSREDQVVPAEGNAGRMERLLEQAATDGTVITVPRGDHRLELPSGRDPEGRWRFPRLSPAAIEALEGWLRSRVSRAGGASPAADTSTSAFISHLRALAPGALARSDASALGVALVRAGDLAWIEGFGTADPATGEPVTEATLFNVGSIAKTVTAWGVLALVEEGAIELDAPVSRYLSEWPLSSRDGIEGITVRRLLAHTAGLGMGSTPETAPARTPDLRALLADSVRRVAEPGSGWRYSGGGYGLLELLVEKVTGRPFAEQMQRSVLGPLGMTRSFFGWRPGLPEDAAAPRHEGAVAGWRDYPVLAAAGLWSTTRDLARFAAASLPGPDGARPGRGILGPGTVSLLTAPAPASERRWGLRYGLGYDLWPTTGGRFAAGHAGQNTGWAAAVWTLPESGDAIVVLTNASDGRETYRWLLCDWIAWAVGAGWGGYCADRADGPRGTLDPFPPHEGGTAPRTP